MEQAGEYDITVKQNSGFTLPLRYEAPEGSPVDFTGSTAQMQVRAKIGAPTVLFELSTRPHRCRVIAKIGQWLTVRAAARSVVASGLSSRSSRLS